jgi:IS5 family transposase
MQTQTSFAELEYISKKKPTRRERFLAQIEAATPWARRWLLAPQGPSAS